MKTGEPTKGLRLLALCIAAAVALAPATGTAGTCEEDCEQVFAECAATEAAGCGSGAGAKKECGERIAPCLRARETCLAGCSSSEGDAWVAAVALDRQGDAAGAVEAYDAFVERFPGSGRVTAAMERISALRAELEAARKAAEEREAEAYRSLRITTDPAWVLRRAADYLASFPDGVNRPEVERMAAEIQAAMATAEEERRRKSIGRPQRGWGIGLMALGGALGVTGGILGGVATKEYNELKDECGGTMAGCSRSDRDDNYTKAVVTDCLLGAAAVSLVTGIIVYATAPSWEGEGAPVSAAIAPTPDGNGAMAGVGGTF